VTATLPQAPAYLARVERMKDRVLGARPEIDLENARILTRSFQTTEGEPLVVRKAKAFAAQCAGKTVTVWDGELIVGSPGSKLRGGILNPDTCWSVLDRELDTINDRRYDPFHLTPEDRTAFVEEIRPYWKGRSTYEAWLAQVPDDTRALRDAGMVYIDRKAVRGWGETTAGYQAVLTRGVAALAADAEAERAKLDLTRPGHYERDCFLRAVTIAADGIVQLAHRYAEEAERQALAEPDPTRRAELEGIARACRRVPEHPARTFQEALQALYLYQCCLIMEQNAASYNPGRVDQYLYPFYQADLEAGRVTPAEAQELLDCLWVKFSETCLFQDALTAEFAAGYPMFQNLCAGGIDQTGRDAVNDLSYMVLQATMDVRLYQPSLSVRYNMAKNPSAFLRKVVELVRLGTGFPAFHNDEVGIKMIMNKGIPLREAYDWNPCGCVETNLEGRLRHYTALADINLGGVVELALTGGVNRKTGAVIAPDTGDPGEFATYEQFLGAVKAQLRHAVRAAVKGSHIIDEICLDRPAPVLSMSFAECLERGLDYSRGGAKYSTGNGIILIGIADLVNSLAAVKARVFEAPQMSMEKLLAALAADFDGFEDVRRSLSTAPKFGNDDPAVDGIAAAIYTFIADEIESYSSKFGRMTPGILPVSGNTPFGLAVGALPSGRHAWKPLADGVSPSGGTDLAGPSAVLRSVAQIPHDRFVQGTLLNLKLEPEFLATEAGLNELVALLRSLCTLGVFHVQFNVVDRETLLAAQRDPASHRGLLIRVAGYTAYFVELGKDVQDDIIGRTTQYAAG
jgi:formate C-acetyltransferase